MLSVLYRFCFIEVYIVKFMRFREFRNCGGGGILKGLYGEVFRIILVILME